MININNRYKLVKKHFNLIAQLFLIISIALKSNAEFLLLNWIHFLPPVFFLYSFKTLEKQRLNDAFSGYRKRPVDELVSHCKVDDAFEIL